MEGGESLGRLMPSLSLSNPSQPHDIKIKRNVVKGLWNTFKSSSCFKLDNHYLEMPFIYSQKAAEPSALYIVTTTIKCTLRHILFALFSHKLGFHSRLPKCLYRIHFSIFDENLEPGSHSGAVPHLRP